MVYWFLFRIDWVGILTSLASDEERETSSSVLSGGETLDSTVSEQWRGTSTLSVSEHRKEASTSSVSEQKREISTWSISEDDWGLLISLVSVQEMRTSTGLVSEEGRRTLDWSVSVPRGEALSCSVSELRESTTVSVMENNSSSCWGTVVFVQTDSISSTDPNLISLQ